MRLVVTELAKKWATRSACRYESDRRLSHRQTNDVSIAVHLNQKITGIAEQRR